MECSYETVVACRRTIRLESRGHPTGKSMSLTTITHYQSGDTVISPAFRRVFHQPRRYSISRILQLKYLLFGLDMSSPPGSPQELSMPVEGPSLLPSSQSSDTAPRETQNDDNLQPSALPVSLVEDAVQNDPPEAVKEDSLLEDKDSSNASTIDIPLLDWVEFESEYKKALTEANEVEDQLVLEFEKLSKVS